MFLEISPKSSDWRYLQIGSEIFRRYDPNTVKLKVYNAEATDADVAGRADVAEGGGLRVACVRMWSEVLACVYGVRGGSTRQQPVKCQ